MSSRSLDVRSDALRHRRRLLPVLLIFGIFCSALVRTRFPVCDEGFYTDPAFNLMAHGSMGSPTIVANQQLPGIGQFTYYAMPLHILTEALAFRVMGTDLMAARSLTVLWGLLALSCWYFFLDHLFPETWIPTAATALLSVDFIFVTAAITSRSDMMSFALGSAALASLLIVSLWLDRKRFAITDIAAAAGPYFAGALGWGFYIAQRPDYFLAQFGSMSQERLAGMARPWTAVGRELVRYGETFGLRSLNLQSVRAGVLAVYIAGVAATLLAGKLGKESPVRMLLWMTAAQFLLLTFLEASKQPWYLLHVIALPISLTAVAGCRLAARGGMVRIGILAAAMLLVGIQAGQIGRTISLDRYHNLYAPAIGQLREHLRPGDVIAASTEIGFGAGFDHVIDDPLLGYRLGKQPDFVVADFVVIDGTYQAAYDLLRLSRPDAYREINKRLAEYKILYKNDAYAVFSRSTGSPP